MAEFECYLCRGIFEDDGTISEEEAIALAEAKFPGPPGRKLVSLCPDCAQELDDARAEELEEGHE